MFSTGVLPNNNNKNSGLYITSLDFVPNMGEGKDREQQTFLSQVPNSTCNVEERINYLQ